MSYPMSDVKGTLRLSHSSQGTTDVKFLDINTSQELTEKLNDIVFTTPYPDYDDYPLSSTVELWIGRTGDIDKIFSGIVVNKEVREEGKFKYEEFLVKQLPDFEINLITLAASTDSVTTHIKDIVKPLTDAGIITTSNVATMSRQRKLRKVTREEIFPVLKNYCKDNTVDFYIDLNDDLNAFNIGEGGNSAISLDQTDLNDPMILSIIYKEDLERVRNTVTIIGGIGSIVPNGSLDYKTETSGDLASWVGEWSNGSSWDTNLNKELANSLTTEGGTKCIHIYKDHDDVFGMAVKKIRGSINLGTTIDMSEGGSLSIRLKEFNKSPQNFTDLLMHTAMADKEVRIRLIDTAGNTITHDAKIPFNRVVSWDIPIKNKTWYTWGQSTIGSWNDSISSMIVTIVYRGTDADGNWFGRGRQRGDLYIDRLHFVTRFKAQYENTVSSSSFGLRQLQVENLYDKLDSNALCVAKAKSMIDYIAFPEEYPSEITLDGNKDFEIGKEMYVKTDKVDGTFTVRRIEHNITGDLDWKTILGLSGSEYIEPKTSREKLMVNIKEKLNDLERRISELDLIFYDKFGGAGDSIDLSGTIKWGSLTFDWTTILGAMGVGPITEIIGSWSDFATAIGPAAITTTGSVATGAINVLGQVVDGFFDGVSGLGKFVTGFFSADSDGRDKFENLFVDNAMINTLAVTEAKIDNLAVTTAKIGSLAVTTAKIDSLAVTTAKINDLAVDTAKIASLAVGTGQIDSLAVTTAKIADLAVTEGKIGSLAVSTIHIQSGAVTYPKMGNYNRWQTYTNQRNIVHTFGGANYLSDTGDYSYNKNELLLELTSGNMTQIYGHLIFERGWNPEFKARCKWNAGFATDSLMRVGMGTTTQPFVFTSNKALVLSSRTWTVNTFEANHLGLHSSNHAEVQKTTTRGATNKLGITISKVDSSGTTTTLKDEVFYTITEGSKTLITKAISFSSSKTLNDGDALRIRLRLEIDGTPDNDTRVWFITSPVKELIIPVASPAMTLYAYVQDDGVNVHYWYGYTSITESNNTRLELNFTHVDFWNKSGSGLEVVYPCRDISTGESFVIRARWDDDESTYYWAFDESDNDTWLYSDTIITPATVWYDGYFQLSADAIGSEELYIFNFIGQEEWM